MKEFENRKGYYFGYENLMGRRIRHKNSVTLGGVAGKGKSYNADRKKADPHCADSEEKKQ